MSAVPHGQLRMIRPEVNFFSHQVDGIRTLANLGSFLLADEMGLGKSLEALTVVAIDFERGWAKRFLIVAPASLKWNWEAEIAEHTLFRTHVLDGGPKQRKKQLAEFAAGSMECLITNYEQVKGHLAELNAIGFDAVIYDEAHYVKNRLSSRTRAVFRLVSPRHMLLTGSPILNNADDLWALLHRIDPAEFSSYYRFRSRHCVFGGFKGKQLIGVKNEAELHLRLKGYMLRRLADDVLDLPPVVPVRVVVDLHPEQRKLYKQARDERLLSIPNDPNPMELENAATRFQKLFQIIGTTATIPGHDDHSAKLDLAVERIQEIVASGEPVVVFTQFRGVLACLVNRLAVAGVPHWQLHGDVPAETRVGVVQEWTAQSEAGNHGVMACMYQVGGVGLNMTAACKMIRLDRLAVPELNKQALKRLDRIGQKRTVHVFDFIAKGTIESRIETIIRNKQKVFGAVVEGNDGDFKKALIEAVLAERDDEGDSA